MFRRNLKSGELYYETIKRKYYIYEGYTDNNLRSDIIFIIYVTKDLETKLVDFIYGGFDSKQAIEETIRRYEEKENN